MKRYAYFIISGICLSGLAWADHNSRYEVEQHARAVEDQARELSRIVARHIDDPRELEYYASRAIRNLQYEIRSLEGAIQDHTGGGGGRDYRWSLMGDYPPNGCRGTRQEGDNNRHIVRSPEEAGYYCRAANVGELYCDAGYDGRYLDRHWRCESLR